MPDREAGTWNKGEGVCGISVMFTFSFLTLLCPQCITWLVCLCCLLCILLFLRVLLFFFSLDQQQQQTCHEAFPLFQLSYCLSCFAVPDVLFPFVFVYNGSALALFLEKGRKSEKDRGTLRSLHKIKQQQQRQQQQTAAGRWRRVGCMHQPAGCKQRYIQAS